MFTIIPLLLTLPITSGQADPVNCSKSGAILESYSDVGVFYHYIPIFVSLDEMVTVEMATIYELLISPTLRDFIRHYRRTEDCWEFERVHVKYENTTIITNTMNYEFICRTKNYGSEFIVSDLYMKKDLSVGVISSCIEGKRIQTVIVNYYFYSIYKVDWLAETRTLMSQYNDSAQGLVPVPLSTAHVEGHKRYPEFKECDPKCLIPPFSDPKSYIGALIGFLVVLSVIGYILLFQMLD